MFYVLAINFIKKTRKYRNIINGNFKTVLICVGNKSNYI